MALLSITLFSNNISPVSENEDMKITGEVVGEIVNNEKTQAEEQVFGPLITF
ncbi:hypothetical protein JCM19233_1175 [Vibrio astriarenae]|nr:hypothetical protein JCM19233_1175 [Vibrio sp. C7]